jgi:hypothetical protein
MRPAALAAVAALAGVACTEPDTSVIPADVVWMEWPAEAVAQRSFDVRIGVWRPCALDQRFRPAPSAGQSSLTFAPYFLVSKEPLACALMDRPSADLDIAPLDTVVAAPGLDAPASARTYEVRGAAGEAVYGALADRAIRTFGEMVVRPTSGTDTRTMAAGFASAQVEGGCLRLRPGIRFTGGYPIENPPDATEFWWAFVRGYLYRPAAPVCGETVVYHLISRE